MTRTRIKTFYSASDDEVNNWLEKSKANVLFMNTHCESRTNNWGNTYYISVITITYEVVTND